MGAALYETAVEEIDERAEPERAAKVLTALATCQWSLGLAERSRATQRRGLELLPPDEDSPARAALLAQRVRFLLLQGRFRDVRDEAPEALEASERAGLGPRPRGRQPPRLRAVLARRRGGRAGAARRVDRARARDAGRATTSRPPTSTTPTRSTSPARAARAARSPSAAWPRSERAVGGRGASRSMRWIRLNLAEIEFDLGDWEARREQLAPAGTPYRGVALAHARLRRRPAGARPRRARRSARRRSTRPTSCSRTRSSLSTSPLLAALRAELERRGGDLDAAARRRRPRDRPDPVLQRRRSARLALVAAAGASIAADAAERARDLGDDDAAERARSPGPSRCWSWSGPRSRTARGRSRRATAGDRRGRTRPRRAAPTTRQLWAAAARRWERDRAPVPAGGRPLAPGPGGARRAATATRRRARWRDAIAGAEGARGRLAGWARRRGSRARARLSLADAGRRRRRGDSAAPSRSRSASPRASARSSRCSPPGATNREIAERALHGREDRQRARLADPRKLDVRSRTEAAAVAHRHGLAAEGADGAETG